MQRLLLIGAALLSAGVLLYVTLAGESRDAPARTAEPRASSAPVAGAPAPAARPEARPPAAAYRLYGTLAGGSQPSAIIATGSGEPAASYRVGDSLPGGAILQAIGMRSVALELDGRVITLQLEGAVPATEVPTASDSAGLPPAYGVIDGEESLPLPRGLAPAPGTPLRRSATGPELTPEQRERHEDMALSD